MTGQRCSAQRSKGRGQCGAYAIHGATVCAAHGGAAGHVRKAAARRVAEAEFARKFGNAPDASADPAGVLLREIGVLYAYCVVARAVGRGGRQVV